MWIRYALALLTVVPLSAQLSLQDLIFEPVATGLVQPLAVTYAPGAPGRLYITEQAGRVRVWENGAVLETAFLDVRSRVSCCGERGLLSIAFHPQFAANGRFFVYYTDLGGDTVVAEGSSADGLVADPQALRALLTVNQPFRNHNGGQLQFGPDGFLYIGTGDGGSAGDPNNAGQDLLTLLGKILRIDVDNGDPYTVPDDNPFAFVDNAQPEIWHYGLRNPWRFSFDRDTGDMLIGDVGQNAREEVDFAAAGVGGLNYGWRRMEGTRCFSPAANCDTGQLTAPILEYAHDPGNCGGSITGGYRYRGFALPAWRGVYFYGDFCTGRLYGATEDGGTWTALPPRQTNFGFAAFGEDAAGEIYIADFAGTLYRITADVELRPAISGGGVVNAASFAPGGSVVAGSLVSVFGTEFATRSTAASGTPLPTELGAVQVFAEDTAIPLVFAGPQQVNGQWPWELNSGTASVTVRTGANVSSAETVSIGPYAPGIFTVSGGPTGQTAALIAGTNLLAAPVSESPAARPVAVGETISLFANALGAVTAQPETGAATPSSPLAEAQNVVRVTIGGMPAVVDFAGLAPGFVALYQVNATVQSGTPSGDAVEIELSVESATSNVARIAVAP